MQKDEKAVSVMTGDQTQEEQNLVEHTDDDESQDTTPTREIHPDAWDSDADSEEESEAKVKGDNEDERAQHGFTVSISKPSVPTKPTKPKPSGS